MTNKLENYLTKTIKYGLYAILLTPLAFWPKALFPFLTPKFILFQILVEIVFTAWLILRLLKSDFGKLLKSDFNNWLAITLASFFVVSFISALLGIDFSRSFWGIGPRMTGLFAELHFLAWFLVLVSISKSDFKNSPKSDFDMTRYLNFSFFVSLLVAATAFYQNPVWGLGFGSTIFNNPTFVAPYFIFHLFWGLYQTITKFQVPSPKFWERWFYGAGSALIIFTIILGQVRGAILGLLIGIFFFGFGLIFSKLLSRRAIILFSIFYFLFSVALIGFWQFRGADFLKVGVLKKFSEISLTNTTVKTRLLAWQVSIKSFGGRQVLGVGLENFNYIFNKYYDPRFLKFGGGGIGETWFDKPHNAFLQILTETGIVGAAAYVLIWFAASLALFKMFKSGKKFLALILVSAFVSYLGSVFFSFDSFGSWFGLYLMFGFLAYQNNSQINSFPMGDVPKRRDPANINQKSEKLFAVFACIGMIGLLGVNFSIWRANITNADALRTFPKDTERGIILFKKSLNYFTPYKSEYRFDLFTALGSAVQTNHSLPDPEETINFILVEADKIIIDHPKDAAYYTNFVKLYDILGERGRDPQILKIAETYGEKSLELSPDRQETLFYLTKNALLLGDTKSAVSYMVRAVRAEPSIGLSHWFLGLAYVSDNQEEIGIAEIKNALELGYKPQNKAEEEFIKNFGL